MAMWWQDIFCIHRTWSSVIAWKHVALESVSQTQAVFTLLSSVASVMLLHAMSAPLLRSSTQAAVILGMQGGGGGGGGGAVVWEVDWYGMGVGGLVVAWCLHD